MRSPRYAPAGLLLRLARPGVPDVRVAIDGGAASRVGRALDAWLVTDEQAELIEAIRRRARRLGVEPSVARFRAGPLVITPRRVAHTSHPTYAYEIRWRGRRVVWAPEFRHLPHWAAGADPLFADASGWSRPIRFRGGAGGHACALDVAADARKAGVREATPSSRPERSRPTAPLREGRSGRRSRHRGGADRRVVHTGVTGSAGARRALPRRSRASRASWPRRHRRRRRDCDGSHAPRRASVGAPPASEASRRRRTGRRTRIPRCKLRDEADDLVILDEPRGFFGVSQFYEEFPQVSDEEVGDLLRHAEAVTTQ